MSEPHRYLSSASISMFWPIGKAWVTSHKLPVLLGEGDQLTTLSVHHSRGGLGMGGQWRGLAWGCSRFSRAPQRLPGPLVVGQAAEGRALPHASVSSPAKWG